MTLLAYHWASVRTVPGPTMATWGTVFGHDASVRVGKTLHHTGTLATAPTAGRPVAAWLGGRRFLWVRRAGQCVSDAASDVVRRSFWPTTARYDLEIGGEIQFWNDEPFSTFYEPALLFLGLSLFVFQIRGVYTLPRSTSFLDETTLVVGGLITAMAGVILAAYFFGFFPSRLMFTYAFSASRSSSW